MTYAEGGDGCSALSYSMNRTFGIFYTVCMQNCVVSCFCYVVLP